MKNVLIVLFLLPRLLPAQELPPELQQQAEWQAEEGRGEAREEWLEDLRPFLRHPLDLNRATGQELRLFPFLHAAQIEQFLRYRQLIGPLVHLYELQAVPGWDPASIRKLLPYVRLGDPRDAGELLHDRLGGAHHLALLFAAGAATPDPAHLGSPWGLQLRYRFQYKTLLSAGLTADKDAGESFFRGGQKTGFDQYSAHLFLRQLGTVEALALGDFRLRLGQGLVHWDGNAPGPGLNPLMSERFSPPVTPYRSASADGYQRGMGLVLRKRAWSLTLFAGQRKLDANLRADGTVSSLKTGGYRRTASELADRGVLRMRTAGFRLERSGPQLRLGLNAIHYDLSRQLLPEAEPYNRFAFRGRRLTLASLDGSGTWRNLHYFGELAGNGRSGAGLAGLLAALHPKADLALVYRHFSRGYATLYAQGFGRHGEPQNETGIYLGLDLRPSVAWQILLAADLYRSPFLRYRLPSTSSGASLWAQLQYRRNKRFQAYGRFRQTVRPQPSGTGTINALSDARHRSVRLHFEQVFTRGAEGSARIEWNRYGLPGQPATEGFLFYIDHAVTLHRLRLRLRWQWVDTDQYENRFYAYEPSLPMSFALPAAAGRHTALYLLARYPLLRALRLEVRWIIQTGREEGSLHDPAGKREVRQEWGAYLAWQF